MTTMQLPDKPKLSYRYEFKPFEIDEIVACNNAHGFAVVKGFLPHDWVQDLKKSVMDTLDPKGDLRSGETRVASSFVEVSEPLARLMDYQPYMTLFASMLGTEEMTLNRSAAILKAPGTPFGMWHTDWRPAVEVPKITDDVLNSGEWPSGFWFYLNGTHPSRGGLALIEDSHELSWPGPEGFELTADRKTFYRKNDEKKGGYCNYDVPGLLPLYTDPGDLIVFAARTYHGVFTHNGTEPRLSCAVGFRPKSHKMNCPWPLPESAQKFVANAPARWKRYLDGYTGLARTWDVKKY